MPSARRHPLALGLAAAAALLASGRALARSGPPDETGARAAPVAPSGTTTSDVVVTGSRVRSLEQFTPTGSRLNLSARETPGTLDLITAETIETRGYLLAEEAVDSLPGVTSGATPGDLSDLHVRGFSDNQVTFLHNGLYIGPASMVNRPQNTFNLQGIEILKGPASVLYGQGAVGGAVNILNKAPSFGPMQGNLAVSYGGFDTGAVGLGLTGALRDDLAVRLDVSRTGTDGFVRRTQGDSFNVTLSVLWKPTPRLDVQFSLDYLSDHPSDYYGTPLVPASFAGANRLGGVLTSTDGSVIDARTRDVQYNVGDADIESHQIWPQLFVKWRVTGDMTIENFLYVFKADRRWRNAETYLYDPATRLINRDRFFVNHNQDIEGDQADVTITKPVFGLANRFNIGVDYSHLDFKRSRGFPDNDEVDPFDPVPGLFGSTENPRISPTYWNDGAVFFEDALSVTPQLKLVTGARFDYLALNRQNFGPTGAFQPAASFRRDYTPFTYRVGLVYDLHRHLTPYLSFTTGQDPVGSNIFLVNAGENAGLSRSKQVEAGVKASAPDGRADFTLAVYDIQRRNVLTADGQDRVTTAGSEYSHGVELSGDLRVAPTVNLNANVAYNKATFGKFRFTDAFTGLPTVANGDRLPNAPDWVANVWSSWARVAGLPVELGGGVRYVGGRAGDYGDTLRLDAYATLNLYATWSVTPRVNLSLRVDNVTDRAYAQAVDVFYERQVILGRPRYVQADLVARF